MKEHIRKTLNHPLISGSAIIFGGTLIANILNFFFNLYMNRNLSIADYGTLASIVSIISLAMVVSGSITPTVVNFAASYFAKNEHDKLRGLFYKLTQYYVVIGVIIFFIFWFFAQPIGRFFNIHDTNLILLTGFSIFFIFVSTINTAFLQAQLAFTFISFTTLFSTVIKFVLGIIFISLGFAVVGGVFAYLISFAVMYFLNFIPMKYLFTTKITSSRFHIKEIIAYGMPAALASFGLTSFATTDLILIKHFFNPTTAGIYAGITLVGKVIFFFSAPIATVMFPLIVQKHTKNENYDSIFFLSLFLVFLPSAIFTIFYFLFPEFAIYFFVRKKEYLAGAGLLGLYSIFTTIYSLLTVMTNYYLSIKKTNVYIPVILGAILQALLIWLYHKTFLQVIMISLILTSLLFFIFLLYYWVTHTDIVKKYRSQ